ncbi:transcriptional repressor [Amycolatopsis acidiphila]|uniref:Transcriptional repressor n=1 Tax=Amycolatopsis acidiphila TaxID=715473 RepID=A0A558AGA9_9PSEU|nr:Fur family transcriptional regulator [Amycolatopsis acidiphila]TVT23266.1 transcriptional repressor [Amycolatopsis acidiphila]UIJ56484.1 transcriptional repressor [Amycolatopsis acidiphila]GHG67004.1 transcriptional repressor [Amycolatopsis acidiphila]
MPTPGPSGQRDSTTDAAASLRSAGLRITAPRRAVLTWLASHPHATAEAVRAGVHDELGSVSHQAVYDVLRACVDAGLVRSIQPAGHPARFERRVADNHHHLVCRGCGRTEDVDCVVGAAPCLTPGEDRGFEVDEAEIVFWGWCPACAEKRKGR